MRVLIVKGSRGAGLGDHLLALNYAIDLSKRSGRKLCIDWRDTPYCNENINLFDALFETLNIDTISLDQLSTEKSLTVCPKQWQNVWGSTFSQVHNQLHGATWDYRRALENLQCNETEAMGTNNIAILWSAHAKGTISRSTKVESHLAKHVRITVSLQQAIEAFVNLNFTDKMIGLHVRMSNEAGLGMKSAPLDLYLEKIRKLRHTDPGAGIFLATDNSNVIDSIKTKFDGVCVAPKWMPKAGQPIHLDDENKNKGINIAREAMIDMLLLARCDWIIYPKESSFSNTATLFSDPNNSSWISLEAQGKTPAIRRALSRIHHWRMRIKTR